MTRVLISGGGVVTPRGLQQVQILIKDGIIEDLLDSIPNDMDASRLDASGKIVLPGAIDGHTHFIPHDPVSDHPKELDDEGFYYGSRGAAAGGITSVVEMPQAYPATTNRTRFQRKRSIIKTESIVDFAMWGGVTPGDALLENIDGQLESGAVAFKGYMCNDDPDLPLLRDAEIHLALQALKDSRIMLGLHTENEDLLRVHINQVKSTGQFDPLAHAASRPPILESTDVRRAIRLAEKTGGWVHIVHLNAIESAALVKKGKAAGVHVTAETCPHYLILDLHDLERLGPYAKCVPPLRPREEVEELWSYLADGTIDCIASDHCGWTTKSKDAGMEDIWKAPNGLTGVQTLLPAIITEARRRGFSWEDIASWTAANPADLWHLSPKKGSIQVGADADFVIVDPNLEWTLNASDLLHAQKWSPFEGRNFQGKIVQTFLRGKLIFDDKNDQKVLAKPGFGQFLKPM
jgi:allantoinase